MRFDEILNRFNAVRVGENTYKANCPTHEDTNASLSISHDDQNGRTLINCLAGCSDKEEILSRVGLKMSDLYDEPIKQKFGYSLKEYADAKRLPEEKLREYGLYDKQREGKNYSVLVIPYFNEEKQLLRNRIRRCLHDVGNIQRFCWDTSGEKPPLYGLWRQDFTNDSIILCEGESDCHTFWLNGYNALGLPGATFIKRKDYEDVLMTYKRVYVFIEKDNGGHIVFSELKTRLEKGTSKLDKENVFFVTLQGYKDPSEIWVKSNGDAEIFNKTIADSMRAAKRFDCFDTSIFPDMVKTESVSGDNEKKDDAKKSDDGRAKTSAVNGAKGGRPKCDYVGLAQFIADTLMQDNRRLIYSTANNGEWYQFNGTNYERRTENFVDCGIVQDFIIKHGAAYNIDLNKNSISNVLCFLKGKGRCFIDLLLKENTWLTDGKSEPYFKTCENGIVDFLEWGRMLANGAAEDDIMECCIHPFTQDFFTTHKAGYAAHPRATCPGFEKFTDDVLPNEDKEDFKNVIFAFAGMCCIYDNSRQAFMWLYGKGGTGKSCMANIISSVVGKDAVTYLSHEETTDHFKIINLSGNLLNVGEENETEHEEQKKFCEQMKKFTGMSDVQIFNERKGKDSYLNSLTARFIFTANDLPNVRDKSGGFSRRAIFIPFENEFWRSAGKVERIDDLIITTELQGIFNLFAMAYYRLNSGIISFFGYDCILKQQDKFRKTASHALGFAERYIARDNRLFLSVNGLFEVFSRDNQWKCNNRMTFDSVVSEIEAFYKVKREWIEVSNGKYIEGLKGLKMIGYEKIYNEQVVNFTIP